MKNKLEEKKKENSSVGLKFALFVVFPVFLIYSEKYCDYSANSKVWTKIRGSSLRSPNWAIFFVVLTISFQILVFKTLISRDFELSAFFFFMTYISQYPLARLYLFFKMNKLVEQNSLGLLVPSVSNAIKIARISHGVEYAELNYQNKSAFESSKCIGKRIEPYDQVLPLFGEPKITESEFVNIFDADDAIFPLNENSPDHHLVIGQTGSGKTTLITRMALTALNENWKVIILDLKGDPTDINKFLQLEKDQSKVIHFPTSAFNFWKGTRNEIAERVISFFPTDSEPFYLNRNSAAVHAVITRSDLPAPCSVEELVHRLRNGLRISQTIQDIKFFSTKERGVEIGEIIANDVSTYLDPIRNVESSTPYRFHWNDNWNLAHFTLDGFEPSALRMANAILHDFASWIFSDERTQKKSPILLIVDEASAFSSLPRVPILTSLMQRARSARVSLVYASQNLSAFKDEKDNILHSGAIRWLGSSTQVQDMVEASGTRSIVESGFQVDNQNYTGTISHRIQKTFKIDPDFVKELKTFHWYVSSRGKVSNVFVPPVDWNK